MRLLASVVALLALVLVLPTEWVQYLLEAASFAGVALQTSLPTGEQGRHYVSEDWDGSEGGVDSATWIEVDGLGEYARSNQAQNTDHHIFGRSQAVTTIGTPSRTITLNGWFASGDPGQDLLRAYSAGGAYANETLAYMYLRDGSNGFAVYVKVGGGEERSSAQGGLQPVTFTLAPQDDPVEVTSVTV